MFQDILYFKPEKQIQNHKKIEYFSEMVNRKKNDNLVNVIFDSRYNDFYTSRLQQNFNHNL